jgi:hypothetical protein
MIYRFAITERYKELEEEEEVTIKIMMALNGSVDQQHVPAEEETQHDDVEAASADVVIQKVQQSVAVSLKRSRNLLSTPAGAAAAPAPAAAYLQSIKVGFFKDGAARGPGFMSITSLVLAVFLLIGSGGLVEVLTGIQSFTYFTNPAGFLKTSFSPPTNSNFSQLRQSTNLHDLQLLVPLETTSAAAGPHQQHPTASIHNTASTTSTDPVEAHDATDANDDTTDEAHDATDANDDTTDEARDEARDEALVSSNSSLAEDGRTKNIKKNAQEQRQNPDHQAEQAAAVINHRQLAITTSVLFHNMEDEELLYKASMLKTTTTTTTAAATAAATAAEADTGTMLREEAKIAFLFLTRGPLPLRALWDAYFEGHEGRYSIYVHAHPNFLQDPTISSSSVFFRRYIPSKVNERH